MVSGQRRKEGHPLGKRPLSVEPNRRSCQGELLGPRLQLARRGLALAVAAARQQDVARPERPFVAGQVVASRGEEPEHEPIEEAPPDGGAAFDQLPVLRREEHGRQERRRLAERGALLAA